MRRGPKVLDVDVVLGLEDLVKACDEPSRHGRHDHAATDPLFPLLSGEARLRHFQSSPEMLLKPRLWRDIPEGSRLQRLGLRMLQFDDLANHLQRKYFRRLKAVCICALGFICGFEVFAHLLEDQPAIRPVILLLALMLLGAAFTVVNVLRSKTYQMAYLSTRAIAEIMRIQFFVEASGVEMLAHEKVPRRYKPILGRVLAVLDHVWAEVRDRPRFQLGPNVVREQWFTGQMKYFDKASKREQAAALKWGRASSVAFLLGIVATVGLVVVSLEHQMTSPVGRTLLAVGPSLLGVAAICEFYLERRGFKAGSERYRHSVHIYDVPETADWQGTVRDVGSEALHEIVDWYVASVEREICVPKG